MSDTNATSLCQSITIERVDVEQQVDSPYPPNAVGTLMEKPVALLSADMACEDAIEKLREISKNHFITYGFVVDADGKLQGVLVMRDLLFADRSAKLGSIMIPNPFSLTPETDVLEAMRLVMARHYPEYPVCATDGRLVGTVRGYKLFEAQAIEISAQAGSMVGIEKQERLATPWITSFKYRHPWLQLNLLTAFVAGAVVSIFQDTIDKLVILAVFLPVLAGQSGNTGCQALAVTLRGMTLGDLKDGKERTLIMKEALLGVMNGALVGVSAALGMYILATMQNQPSALWLSFVVFMAMVGSCAVSGVSGALIPMTLKKLGADPATASSIFLTTMTDVASMGLLLGLASVLLM